MTARTNAIGAAAHRAVGFAIPAMLWIRLEVIGTQTGALTATSDNLVIHRRGVRVTDVVADPAIVRIIRCESTRIDSVGRAARTVWRTVKFRSTSSAILPEWNALPLAARMEQSTRDAATATVV